MTRRAPRLALAVTGTVIGHSVAYLVAAPHGHERASLLRQTGHAYWHAAVVAAVVGAAWFGVDHLRSAFRAGRVRQPATPGRTWAGLTRELVVLQLLLFAGMEVVERAWAGSPLTGLLAHHIFFIGAAAQLLVAPLLAFAFWLAGLGARAVGQALAGARFLPAPAAILAARPVDPFVPRLAMAAVGIRGPPARSPSGIREPA